MRILPSHWKCHVRHVLHSTLAQQSLCMPSWHHGNSSQCKPISLPPPHWKGSVTHENKRHFLNHEPLSFQPSMIRGQGCARFHAGKLDENAGKKNLISVQKSISVEAEILKNGNLRRRRSINASGQDEFSVKLISGTQ